MDAHQEENEQDWEDFTLFEFKAGLMKKTGTQLSADPRRGTVRMLRVSFDFSSARRERNLSSDGASRFYVKSRAEAWERAVRKNLRRQ